MAESPNAANSGLLMILSKLAQWVIGVLFIGLGIGSAGSGASLEMLPFFVAGFLITPTTWDILLKNEPYPWLVEHRRLVALVAAFICIGIIAAKNIENRQKEDQERSNISQPRLTSKVAPAARPIEPVAPAVSPPAVSSQTKEDSDNHCFTYGKSMASVALVNIKKMASAGLQPSEVMEEGCSRESTNAVDRTSCIHYCQLGFKSVVRDFLK